MDFEFTPLSAFEKHSLFDFLTQDEWEWYLSEFVRRGRIYAESRNRSFMVVNTFNTQPLFISRQVIDELGYTVQELHAKKEHFLSDITHPDDDTFFHEIRDRLRVIMDKFDADKKLLDMCLQYTVRYLCKDQTYMQFDCNLYPMVMLNGRSTFALVSLRKLERLVPTSFQVFFMKENVRYIYSSRLGKLVLEDKVMLKPIEMDILKYVAQGVREQNISKKMNVDVNTIKYYKKNIMEKLSVYSMPQAVYYALRKGII
ncbi:MAG: LuxR C-terminal-related transcriptional regulator [Tannerellaceae bacterium]